MSGFWWQWGYRSGFSEKLQEASPMFTEAMPAASRTDLLWDMSKPTSDGGSTSAITDLRREKKSAK